jgi:hypothetical protein
MGEMLAETERAKGKLKRGPVVTTSDHGETPTLAELGLTKNEASRAQRLAALPRETFEAVKSGKKTRAKAGRITGP